MPVRSGLYRSTGEGKRSRRAVKRLLSLLWCLNALPSSISPPLPLHLSPCRLIHTELYTFPQIWLIPRANISFSFSLAPLCYSLFFHFIPLRVIPSRTISPALPLILLSVPLTVLKIRFSALFWSLSSIIANSSTYLFTPSDTCAWMQKCRKCVCSSQHTAAASPNQPWLQGWHLTGWWVMFKNFNFSKLLLINRWWNEAVEVNKGLCFVLLRVAFTDYIIDLLVCVVTKWAICK